MAGRAAAERPGPSPVVRGRIPPAVYGAPALSGRKAPRPARGAVLLVPILVLLASLVLAPAPAPAAGQGGWPPEYVSWLSALTYGDEDPSYFGTETPAVDREILRRFRPRIYTAV